MLRFYRWLLKLYPARFREEYEIPMQQQFHDDLRESLHPSRVLARATADVIRTAPIEFARQIVSDFAFAARVFRKDSASAALAVVALGLATGAGTAVFSVLNALLLRDLPFREPDHLVELMNIQKGWSPERAKFLAWREGAQGMLLEHATIFTAVEMNLTHDNQEALRVKAAETDAAFFDVMGVRIVNGRGFAPGEDIPGGAHYAVIGHALWQQYYGGNPGILGESIRLNGKTFTIVGVAPPRFDYPRGASVWISSFFDFEVLPKEGSYFFETTARLRKHVTPAQVRQLLGAEIVNPVRGNHDLREPLLVLAGAVLFVLLAACVNIAQLLLSRNAERSGEFRIRHALGATFARLARQQLTEAVFLAVLGAFFGILAAYWGTQLAAAAAPPELEAQRYTLLDWRVLGFAVLLTLATGLLCGWLPARARAENSLRARNLLLAAQAAITLVLLAGAWTMGRTFTGLLQADLGFEREKVVAMTVSLAGSSLAEGPARWNYYQEALRRIREVPGVESAGAARFLPFVKDVFMANSMKLDSGAEIKICLTNAALPGYFQAIGAKLIAGRDFQPRETERVAIVNEPFARETGLGRNAVGRSFTPGGSNQPYRIVGVVADMKMTHPRQRFSPSMAYFPVEHKPSASLNFLARVRGAPEDFTAVLRDTLRTVDTAVPVFNVLPLDQRFQAVVSRPRFLASVMLFFAALALLLALIGIFGSVARSIAQRRKEIGIRMALGSTAGALRARAVAQVGWPLAAGACVGVWGAHALGRSMRSWLEGSEPPTLLVHVAVGLAMLLVATAAAWVSSSRIASIDPTSVLRSE